MDTATKSGLDAAKFVSKKEVYKTAQALKKFIGKNCWKNCKTQTSAWRTFKKFWRNSYSAWKKTKNTKEIKVSAINRNARKYLNF